MPRPIRSVNVPAPCEAGPGAFTPTPGGFHCARCAHAVVDFTGWTDGAVVRHLAAASGRVCGRFTAAQLDGLNARLAVGDLMADPAPGRWPALAATVAAVGLMAGGEASAQGRPEKPRTEQAPAPPAAAPRADLPAPTKGANARAVLTGTVKERATGEPLPGAVVSVEGAHIVTTTDIDGRYTLDLSALTDTALVEVQAAFVGFLTGRIVNVRMDGPRELHFVLAEVTELTGEIVVGMVGDPRAPAGEPPPMVRRTHYGAFRSRQ